ncbi:tRNA preQ1(34) S-adenosylmethionine ribosyltransferase-isomerase QueA [Candidatus Nanosyncoccus alces]|uniref:S-adenosylmethionine:tRNA ribosyltransferase-isomerase n=1 Tax=Candidatus Nanosyncoccus alces TaxID=2171997 RepID=A0ABY0FL18_9BACT|nr:tRNA preQ1(34) S-adenosylmethionine ribosyltransferase-isomerase QueA [Candidatus Nanosyncoccus alces]RYC74456.1 S-adenosylmethionine:tRNA ribosyltransferase-isomerase [Candidatus Nanosyncoccus alces]
MLVSDYNYDLPEKRIAKFPPEERGSTRLLVLNRKTGRIQDSYYKNLDKFLNPGDVLILNDTRVMQSRLFCELPDGRKRELVVLEKHGDEPQKVMYRGKLHDSDVLKVANQEVIVAKILGNGIAEVESDTPLVDLAERYGTVPLPPYLHRDAEENDKKRYQTVWAKNMGSAAAPTASLNMTEELLEKLKQKGVIIKYLTLHVGLGTFLPIRTDEVENHKMHSEWFNIPETTIETINTAKSTNHRVVALGTTVARTLEYYGKTGETSGEDDIFIYPGFEFQVIDALLTNFHAPKSTVLMLASAFAGWDHLKNAYDHAVATEYNFLSYGDSMLIC